MVEPPIPPDVEILHDGPHIRLTRANSPLASVEWRRRGGLGN